MTGVDLKDAATDRAGRELGEQAVERPPRRPARRRRRWSRGAVVAVRAGRARRRSPTAVGDRRPHGGRRPVLLGGRAREGSRAVRIAAASVGVESSAGRPRRRPRPDGVGDVDREVDVERRRRGASSVASWAASTTSTSSSVRPRAAISALRAQRLGPDQRHRLGDRQRVGAVAAAGVGAHRHVTMLPAGPARAGRRARPSRPGRRCRRRRRSARSGSSGRPAPAGRADASAPSVEL